MSILLPSRFYHQPQYAAPLHPEWLARGLVVVCNPAVGAYNQASGRPVTKAGGMSTSITQSGKSWQGGSGKYIDFGSGFSPGTGGCTVLQVINPGSATASMPFSSRVASGTGGVEILIAAAVAGTARFRMHAPEVATADITGLNDGLDHVLVARFTPSTEVKLWADSLGKSVANTTSIPASTTATQNLSLHNRGGLYYTGKSGLFLYFNRPLHDSVIASLLENPYLVYRAPPRRLYPAASGGTITGTVDYTNANDTSSASGTTTVTGASATTNANDTSAATGSPIVDGVSATTNADDTSSTSGSVGSAIVGTVAYTNIDDTASTSGTTTVIGSAAASNVNDTSSADGTTTIVGSSATTNADDVCAATGTVEASVTTGTVAYTNADDISAATGTTTVVGTSATTNTNDTVSAYGVVNNGTIVEAGLTTGSVSTIRIKKPGIPVGTPDWLKTTIETLTGRRGNKIEVPKFQALEFTATPTKAEVEALYAYTNTVRDSLEQLINRMDG